MQKIAIGEKITLFQGDALKILAALPDASVDAVLTDPPYSSAWRTLAERQLGQRQKYQKSRKQPPNWPTMLGDNRDQHSWTFWGCIWLAEAFRIAREGAPLMVFCDWRQIPALTDAIQAAGWLWNGIVVWDKVSSRPQRGRFRSQCEYVVFASKGKFAPASSECVPGVYRYFFNAEKRHHIAAKPMALMTDLLALVSKDAVVLDPFMGSASVGVACMQTGRGYIGVELSPEYFAIARTRVEKTIAECAG